MLTASQTLTAVPKSPADAGDCVDSMLHFLLEHPEFRRQPLEWTHNDEGLVFVHVRYLHPETQRLMVGLAAALHGKVSEGCPTVSTAGQRIRTLHVDAIVAGVQWAVAGWLPEDSFTVFTDTHNPDPQEWPAAERAEYAAFAASQIGAAA